MKYSPLTIALTQLENVLISIPSKAYTTTNYVDDEQQIYFDIHNQSTSISKSCFCNLLGLPHSDNLVNLETISNAAISEMFYQIGYKETLTAISKFKKPNLPATWNALFTILFKAFSERVTENDCASKLFMGLMYGLYIGENVDYGSILWAQVIQSTHSTNRHSEISCARLCTVIVHRAIQQLKIPMMSDVLMAPIATLHTTGIIVADPSNFSFIGSTPEAMFPDVSATSKILEGYRTLTRLEFCPMTVEFQAILAEVEKARNGEEGQRKLPRKTLLKKDLQRV